MLHAVGGLGYHRLLRTSIFVNQAEDRSLLFVEDHIREVDWLGMNSEISDRLSTRAIIALAESLRSTTTDGAHLLDLAIS